MTQVIEVNNTYPTKREGCVWANPQEIPPEILSTFSYPLFS